MLQFSATAGTVVTEVLTVGTVEVDKTVEAAGTAEADVIAVGATGIVEAAGKVEADVVAVEVVEAGTVVVTDFNDVTE